MMVVKAPEIPELVLTRIALLLRTGSEKTQSMPLMDSSHHRASSVEEANAEVDEDSDDIPLAPIHTIHNNTDHGA